MHPIARRRQPAPHWVSWPPTIATATLTWASHRLPPALRQGDALLNNFLIPMIGRLAGRHKAKSEPTQYLMDEACRSRNPAYLPWRMIHLVKAWYFGVVLSTRTQTLQPCTV